MKSKFHLILALVLTLALSGGVYAYTFTTASGTINIAEPTGDVVTSNATATQPDWDSVLDDLASENKTCGEVPTGDLFTVTRNGAYTGDLVAKVYLANTGNLTKAYSYLNMKLYLEGSAEAEETPNYRLLTLQNGEAALTLEDLAGISGSFSQTSQGDFEAGTPYQVDTTTSPGDVLLDTYADNVTDTYDDESKIASSANVTVTGGQVKLTGASGNETLRPNAAGDDTSISSQYPDSGAHWEKVDEVTSDDGSTYVYTSGTTPEDWYTGDWQYRKKITIDHTEVPANLTDFPVLISLPSDTDLAADAQDDGDDILFTSANGISKLYHEIEEFDGATGELISWVKVPSLSASANTTLYMYYGNATVGDQQDVENVWDTNYKLVTHMKDDPDTSHVRDSTSNDNDGTKTGPGEPAVTTNGQIDDAQDFDGGDDYVDVPDDNSLDVTNVTLSAWVKSDTAGRYIIAKDPPDTEILRPNAAGDECNIFEATWPNACPDHWEMVDDVTPDEGSTVVRDDETWHRDLYNLPSHSEGSGTINYIKVYARCRAEFTPNLTSLRLAMKTGGTAHESSEITLTTSWVDYSNQWNTNPTTEAAWTWDDIDALQIGLVLRRCNTSWNWSYCTQVYVEVDYSPGKSNMPYALSTVGGGQFMFISSDTTYSATSTTNITDSQWHHLTGTYDGETIRLYVDGVLEDTNTDPSGNLPTNDGNVRIGADYQTTPANFFDGPIDEVRVSSTDRSAGWIETSYNNQSDPGNFHSVGAEELPNDWYGGDWQYRKKITINSANVSASLTDFPVLISLSSDTDLAADAQNDGDDILFTSANGTSKLSHEIEEFDGATGELVSWVKVPSLSASANTTLYMYYGNATVGDQQDVENVWDINYKLVTHMKDDPDTSHVKDSTSNDNDGTKTGAGEPAVTTNGQIDDAQDFDGSDDYIVNTNEISNPQVFTLELWFKTDTDSGGILIGFHEDQFPSFSTPYDRNVYMTDDGEIIFGVWGSVYSVQSEDSYNDDTWHHVVAKISSEGMDMFIDGESVGTDGHDSAEDYDGYWSVGVGGINENWPSEPSSHYFNGPIDEVRISSIARSDGWIETSYNNQSDPGNFHSVGAAEELQENWYGGGGGWQYRKKITIDHTKVSANLTDFPVLISLPSDTDLAADAQDDGDDILFTSANGISKLSHEIEEFDGATGELVSWVKVPSLSASANTTLYLYYGNATVGDQQDVENVWDINYKLVTHMKDDPDTSHVRDSTSNDNDGTKTGAGEPAVTTNGQIDDAQDFDGSDDQINSSNSTDFDFDETDSFSYEAWINADDISDGTGDRIIAKREGASIGIGDVSYDTHPPEDYWIPQVIEHEVSGTNKLLIVGWSIDNDFFEYLTGVTWNDTPLTKLVDIQLSDDARSEIWYLIDPEDGTYDVVLTMTGQDSGPSQWSHAGVITFTGVDQNTPFGDDTTRAWDPFGSASIDVDSAVGDVIFAVAAIEEESFTGVGSGQIAHWLLQAGITGGGGTTKDGEDTSTTVSFTISASNHVAMAGVAIQPVAAGPAGYDVSVRSNGLQFEFSDGTTEKSNTIESISADTWYHVMVTIDRSADLAKLYVDGTEEASVDISAVGSPSNIYPLTISGHGGGDKYFDGTIDEVRISNIARSAGWIETGYNSQSDPGNFYGLGAEKSAAPVYERDLYNIPDHSTGSGSIDGVTAYFRFARSSGTGDVYARVAVKTYGTVYTGSEESTATDTFVTESYQWTTNPNTSADWTWDEIDALQTGIDLKGESADDYAACTQVYIKVDYTAYYPTGTLTSINLLSGETVGSIDTFGYDASAIPSGTSLKVQFSTDNTTWYNSAGTPDGWDTLSQGTDNISLSGLGWSGPNFYYHMQFTSDGNDTPVLDEITVIFYLYYTSGTLTSSAYDAGDDDIVWDWGTISFTINEPSATDIVFQIRTASTEGGLSAATWYGPTGTGDYYTTTSTALNSVHDGDRWIQYKAYFSGPGDDTPTFSDIEITYSAQAMIYTIEVIGGSYCLVSDDTGEWGEGWTVTPELYCEVTPR